MWIALSTSWKKKHKTFCQNFHVGLKHPRVHDDITAGTQVEYANKRDIFK